MTPTLCVGLPVYNGASGLAAALDSLLAQDVSDLEIVVSDNGSTDATPALCRAAAARNPRLRYFREESNRGPTWNFNRVLEAGRQGRYFMWAAHDDRRAPDFASSCIRFLESHPEALLCGTHAAFTDASGAAVELDPGGSTLGLPPVARAERYLRFVDRNSVFYGVYRSAALAGRSLVNAIAGDHAFLTGLSLAGSFHVLPELKLWRRLGGTSRTVASIARTLGVPLTLPGPLARFEILRTMLECIRRLPGLSEGDRFRLRRELYLSTSRRFVRRRLALYPRVKSRIALAT